MSSKEYRYTPVLESEYRTQNSNPTTIRFELAKEVTLDWLKFTFDDQPICVHCKTIANNATRKTLENILTFIYKDKQTYLEQPSMYFSKKFNVRFASPKDEEKITEYWEKELTKLHKTGEYPAIDIVYHKWKQDNIVGRSSIHPDFESSRSVVYFIRDVNKKIQEFAIHDEAYQDFKYDVENQQTSEHNLQIYKLWSKYDKALE